MDKYNISEYPYGQFPTKFTKLGQEKYFEQITKNEQVSALNIDTNNNPPNEEKNNFDFSKLLPILKLMGDKKSISNNDILQMILPLIGGGNMSGISEIMSLFNNDTALKEDEEDIITDDIPIDNYKRVD